MRDEKPVVTFIPKPPKLRKISGRRCEYCRQERRRNAAVYDVGNYLYLCPIHAAPWLLKQEKETAAGAHEVGEHGNPTPGR